MVSPILLNSPIAPLGCFVDADLQLYYNPAGSIKSEYSFLKAICAWTEPQPFVLPTPRQDLRVDACGQSREDFDVYDIEAQYFEKALGMLRNSTRPLAFRLGNGTVRISKDIGIGGSNFTADIAIIGVDAGVYMHTFVYVQGRAGCATHADISMLTQGTEEQSKRHQGRQSTSRVSTSY